MGFNHKIAQDDQDRDARGYSILCLSCAILR
jgi:hypothetical protein